LILPRRGHHGGKACEQSKLVHVDGEGAVRKGTFEMNANATVAETLDGARGDRRAEDVRGRI
jgi:hypothetical protein